MTTGIQLLAMALGRLFESAHSVIPKTDEQREPLSLSASTRFEALKGGLAQAKTEGSGLPPGGSGTPGEPRTAPVLRENVRRGTRPQS